MKKWIAFLLTMVCLMTTTVPVFAAEPGMVDVFFDGNGGTFSYFDDKDNDPRFSEGMSKLLDAGKSLKDDGLTITDPTFFDSGRNFEGWVLKVRKTVTDEYGNRWEDWVQLEDTTLMTTEEILAYQVTGDYESIKFEAKYKGDDNDYFSEVQLDLFGGEMKITEYRFYRDDEKGEEGKYSEERTESFWSTRLREDGTTIYDQTKEWCDLSATPTKDGATFEGWIQAKIVYEKDDNENLVSRCERVSDTIYKTEEILNMKVPHDDTRFAAKWSDMDVKEYYWNGPMRNLFIQGEGGVFSFEVLDGWDETDTEGAGFEAKATLPVSKTLKSLTDPTFFNPDRKFLGWKICELQEVDTDYWEWVQIPGTKICNTQELMEYVIPEGQTELGFIAQWDGDFDEYYSLVHLTTYGGEMEVTSYEYEWDDDKGENVKVPSKVTITDWSSSLREDGTTIGAQTKERCDLSATPTKKNGATFEGWLQFKSTGDNHETFELVSSKPYTIEEILNMKVPHDDTTFAAKWSDIVVEDYFAPQADNYFDTNNGDMSTTYVDDDGKTVTESINGYFGMSHLAKPTLKEYFEYANVSIHSMKKPCEAFDGWTVTEYEWSDYVSCPVGEEFNSGNPDAKYVYIGTYYDDDEECEMESWLGMVNYKEYPNKMSTDEIMKLDGTKNHHFIANWKEDTSKPSESVKPVVKNDAIESVTNEVKKVVDAINSGNVTDEMKEQYSSELIDAIKAEIDAGNKISIEIVANVVTEDKVDADAAAEIKKNLGEDGKLAQYLDLTVMVKSVTADGTEKELGALKELDKEIAFTIVIPENLVQDGRVFFVLRNHDGKVDKLALSKNADGSFSFKTDRFSTYALAYENVKTTTSDTTTLDTTTSDTITLGTNNIAPNTGDNSNIILYGAVALMAAVVLAVLKKSSFVK